MLESKLKYNCKGKTWHQSYLEHYKLKSKPYVYICSTKHSWVPNFCQFCPLTILLSISTIVCMYMHAVIQVFVLCVADCEDACHISEDDIIKLYGWYCAGKMSVPSSAQYCYNFLNWSAFKKKLNCGDGELTWLEQSWRNSKIHTNSNCAALRSKMSHGNTLYQRTWTDYLCSFK